MSILLPLFLVGVEWDIVCVLVFCLLWLLKSCGICVLRCDEVGHTFFFCLLIALGIWREKNCKYTHNAKKKKSSRSKKRQIIAFERKRKKTLDIKSGYVCCHVYLTWRIGEWTCSHIDTIYLFITRMHTFCATVDAADVAVVFVGALVFMSKISPPITVTFMPLFFSLALS